MPPTPVTPAPRARKRAFDSSEPSSSQHRTRSTGPIKVQRVRRDAMTPRNKVDCIERFIREETSWSVKDFISAYITEGPTATYKRSSLYRRRSLFILFDGHLKELLEQSDERLKAVGSIYVRTIRKELRSLVQNSPYFGAWSPTYSPRSIDQTTLQNDIQEHAPFLYELLQGLSGTQRAAWSQGQASRDSEGPGMHIFAITAMLGRLFARNSSNWWASILGLHLHVLGTKDRGLDLLSKVGYCINPRTIRNKLDQISSESRVVLKLFGQAANLFVQWDNFDYMQKVSHQVMGVGPKQRSVTTGRVYISPHFSSLVQSQIHWSRPLPILRVFDAPGISFDGMQQRTAAAHCAATLKSLFPTAARSIAASYNFPSIEPLDLVKTRSHVLDAIYANEGTVDGTYDVHDRVFLQQLGLEPSDPSFGERLVLLVGDQKTASLSRRLMLDMEEASSSYDRKQWLLPVGALFHWRQNCLWALQSVYSGTVDGRSQATLASHMNFWKLLQVPLEKAPFHQVEQLVLQSWDTRLLAVLYRYLEAAGIDVSKPRVVEAHLALIGPVGVSAYIERLVDQLFTEHAYKERTEWQDQEYLSHVCFLNDALVYKTMVHGIRHGNIGHIERALNASMLWCAGTKASNYTIEMLTFRWLCSVAGGPELRHAVLASSIVNLSGRHNAWVEVDYHGEVLNGKLKTCLYDRRSSTFSIELTLSRMAMVQDYMMEMRDSLESAFNVEVSNVHKQRSSSDQLHELAYDLSRSSIKQHSFDRTNGFAAPDVRSIGAAAIVSALASFNDNRLHDNTAEQVMLDITDGVNPADTDGDQLLQLEGVEDVDMLAATDENTA